MYVNFKNYEILMDFQKWFDYPTYTTIQYTCVSAYEKKHNNIFARDVVKTAKFLERQSVEKNILTQIKSPKSLKYLEDRYLVYVLMIQM